MKKIRAVWQNKRDRGVRVSPTVPYGYKKAKKDTPTEYFYQKTVL